MSETTKPLNTDCVCIVNHYYLTGCLERIRAKRAQLDTKTKTAKKSPNQTGARRRKKAKPQDAEPVQLELGLE